MWVGQLLSNIGSGLTAFTLGVYVFQQTASAIHYSLIILAAFLPAVILKPIGGALADRLDRRLLMIIGDSGSAFSIIVILLMWLMGITDLWEIYLGITLGSIFVALQNPAYKASVTDLVDKTFYSKASGLMQLAESSRYLISPIVAGILIKFLDIKLILIIDFLTFLIAIVTVFWIKKDLPKHKSDNVQQYFIADFISGFQYIYKNNGLLCLLSIASLITFFIGFLQALLGPMILDFANAQTLGISQTISTTGMLVSSLFIGIFSYSVKKIPILAIALFFAGLSFSLLGISTNIFIITAFGFLFFFTLPFVNTSLDVLIRSNVANSMQGRVWAIVSLISQSGMVIAFGIAGYLADKIFNPLLQANGALASSVGTFIGIGVGRGIGLMFVISGSFVAIIAIVIGKLKTLKALDNSETSEHIDRVSNECDLPQKI